MSETAPPAIVTIALAAIEAAADSA